LPGYVKDYEKLVNEKGVEYIGCISVNDVFVMKAWGEHHNVPQGGIHMLADPLAEFTKALGLEFTHPALVVRSKRWAMVVKDGKVAALNVEPDNTGLSCSLVNEIYKYL
jgi:2-Cys peroxiredoxin 5